MSIKNLQCNSGRWHMDLQISKRVKKTHLGNNRMNRRGKTKKAEGVYLHNIIKIAK